MPFLKGDNNPEAAKIHEEYQRSNNQKAFLEAARQFLQRQRNPQQQSPASKVAPSTPVTAATSLPSPPIAPQVNPVSSMPEPQTQTPTHLSQSRSLPIGTPAVELGALGATLNPRPDPPGMRQHEPHGNGSVPSTSDRIDGLDNMQAVEDGLGALLDGDDPIVPLTDVWNRNLGGTTSQNHSTPASNMPFSPPRPFDNHPGNLASLPPQGQPISSSPSLPHWGTNILGQPYPGNATPSSSNILPSQSSNNGFAPLNLQQHSMQHPMAMSPQQQQQQLQLLQRQLQQQSLTQPLGMTSPTNGATAERSFSSNSPVLSSNAPIETPVKADESGEPSTPTTLGTPATKPTTARKEAPPKRMWTHFVEQPGRIAVDGVNGEDTSIVLEMAPRQELIAHWSLPLEYVNQKCKGARSLQHALSGLVVGLFRRGCTEKQASIISKKVIGEGNRSYDYGIDHATNSVRGKLPFFSPRTPGHVLFRMYWEKEPLYTLATGPTLHVRVLENEFDGSVRFILSNFKGKKSNPTSLSSLNSLAQVLETQLTRPNESAGRAVWGCIQEARKVIEACAAEYEKTTTKLMRLEDTVEDLKKQVEEEDTKTRDVSDDELDGSDHLDPETSANLREKTKTLMSGKASCERKWRDSQLAFASILRAAITNPAVAGLLKRDQITKMRLEYELWCPLSEEFASPNEDARLWYDALRDMNNNITADDFTTCAQSRAKMQMRTLGFIPNTTTLTDILFPRNPASPNQRSMDPRVVSVFNNMSAAMGQYYQELFADEERVVRLREHVRERTEQCVQACGAFPSGTRVVIFGSSANGFGSPKSDIDMCLQVPPGAQVDTDDSSGSEAMSKLANHFQESGMKDVDTARLTARIPIIKYFCPIPDREGEFIECDISRQNPLAVLNTGLLRSYAEISPVTRVLASIVKRWAKARDINNPARHTLSSYGYILMILHFLTYHKRAGNGLLVPVAPPGGDPRYRRQPGQQEPPILPNIQWMDPMWPSYPRGTPYRDLPSLPRQMIPHPFEEGKSVNSYYFQPKNPNDKAMLQMLFPGQDLSLAILLASFFRYYAYEFDYKRFVVSLHSTATRGLVEREVKAEIDGWRNYSAALTIEDPFETFYDVAHVLRGGYYHRIRREFAVAYTKIADAASGRDNGSWKDKGDLSGLSGVDLIDWICEPVSSDRDQQEA